MVDTVYKRFSSFLRKIHVASYIFIAEANLADFIVRHGISVLVKQHIIKVKLRLSDWAGAIRFVDFENTDNKSAFTHRIHIVNLDFIQINIVCRFTADYQFFEERSGLSAEYTDIGGRQECTAYAFFKEHFLRSNGFLMVA